MNRINRLILIAIAILSGIAPLINTPVTTGLLFAILNLLLAFLATG